MQNNRTNETPRTTVVVDDTPATARAICRFLELEMGTEVAGVARSGNEAIEMARSLQPDLMLVDLFMPGMSGLEVMRSVRSASPKTRIIIITVLGEDMNGTCRSLGAEGFIVKNRLRETLPGEIDRVFRNH